MKVRMFLIMLLAALLVLVVCEAQAWGDKDDHHDNVKQVNCSKGQTITHALEECDGNPITIEVKGTCNENVTIDRDDVTLMADPSGGAINGLDPNKHTIDVRAGRTTIDGLTVTGGWNGINVYGSGGLTIRNSTVQDTGRSGIVFSRGSYGAVDNCMVQKNGDRGIYIEGASVSVTNSTISYNKMGIQVALGGNARIGVPTGQYAGNTISNNYGNGIFVFGGSSAAIGGNTINGNGTDFNMIYGISGIFVLNATATLVGSNTIANNKGVGVLAASSTVRMAEPGFGLPTHNTITGNGTGPSTIPRGGALAQWGTSLVINDADISNNIGNGVALQGCSIASFVGPGPIPTVTGNSGFGLQCNDANSCSRFGGNTSGITGNMAGDVSPNCMGF